MNTIQLEFELVAFYVDCQTPPRGRELQHFSEKFSVPVDAVSNALSRASLSVKLDWDYSLGRYKSTEEGRQMVFHLRSRLAREAAMTAINGMGLDE